MRALIRTLCPRALDPPGGAVQARDRRPALAFFMTRSPLALLAAATLLAPLPLLAQSSIALGERPIRRTEVIAFVQKQFAAMDANHDKQVSPAEFEAFRARQPEKSQAGLGHVGGRWFEKADADGDGRVTLGEAQARPLQLFDMADANGDGIASLQEQSVAALFFGK